MSCIGLTYTLALAELTVTINPGQDTPFQPITLQTHDTEGLRRLLDECKRLKEASGMSENHPHSEVSVPKNFLQRHR